MTNISFKSLNFSELRRQRAIAYMTIYAGKLIGASGKAPPTPTKKGGKNTPKQFKKIADVSYKHLSAATITDKTKSLDEINLTFSDIPEKLREELLDTFIEGSYMQVVWGVRGLWHFRRVFKVRTISAKFGAQTDITIVGNGTGARLQEGQSSQTYNNRRISAIIGSVAQAAGLRTSIQLKKDPVVQHLSAGRRSPLEVLYQLADRYGFYVQVINNVIYATEINDGQPVRRFNFGGPRANVLEYNAKSTIAGIEGARTKAKNREDNSGAQTGQKQGPVNRSLSIQYKDTGKGYTTRVSPRSTKPTATQKRNDANSQNRTHHTLKRGGLASRVVTGKNIKRILRTKKASLVLINEPLTPNVNIILEGLGAKYDGRYCTHDIRFEWTGGYWKVTGNISRASTTRKPGTAKKKGSKSPTSRKRLASPNPKLVVTYNRSGNYSTRRTGTGRGTRSKPK